MEGQRSPERVVEIDKNLGGGQEYRAAAKNIVRRQ
jgi:hypothetical protein